MTDVMVELFSYSSIEKHRIAGNGKEVENGRGKLSIEMMMYRVNSLVTWSRSSIVLLHTGSRSDSTATVPTNTPSQTATLSQTRTLSKSLPPESHPPEPHNIAPSSGDTGSERRQGLGLMLADWYPLLKIMEIQV